MRDKLFRWMLNDMIRHRAGEYLPWWLRTIWIILFPMKAIYHKVGSKEGYQPFNDTWKIHGQEYSDDFFRHFGCGDNYWFRVKKDDFGVLVIEQKSEK